MSVKGDGGAVGQTENRAGSVSGCFVFIYFFNHDYCIAGFIMQFLKSVFLKLLHKLL